MNVRCSDESYAVIGACFHVYNEMGCGFLEAVYQECLAWEFSEKGIPFVAKPKLEIRYREHLLQQYYEADFICFDKVIVELKAVSGLGKGHQAQVLNYLTATGFSLGLLINFGHYPGLEYKRLVK